MITRRMLTAEKVFGEALLQRALKMNKTKVKMTHWDYLELVKGDLHKIDKRTGQKNDASYMAYALEYVVCNADK